MQTSRRKQWLPARHILTRPERARLIAVGLKFGKHSLLIGKHSLLIWIERGRDGSSVT